MAKLSRSRQAPQQQQSGGMEWLNNFLSTMAGRMPQAPQAPAMPQAAPRQRNTYVPGSYAPLSSLFVGSGQRGYKPKQLPQGGGVLGPQVTQPQQNYVPNLPVQSNPFQAGSSSFVGPMPQSGYVAPRGASNYGAGGVFGRQTGRDTGGAQHIAGFAPGSLHERNPYKNWNSNVWQSQWGGDE